MNMKAIAQRLSDQGHWRAAVTAGRYACLRSWDESVRMPAPKPELQELYDAINACDDAYYLEELHAFIEPDYVNWGATVDVGV